MSKVLEEEYRQLAESDIPDLWNRIEAGLNTQSIEAAPDSRSSETVNRNDPARRNRSDVSPAQRNRVMPRRSLRKYAGIVAACICAAIIIPAALNRGKINEMSMMPDAEAPAAEAEMAEAPAAEAEMAEAAAEDSSTGGSAPESQLPQVGTGDSSREIIADEKSDAVMPEADSQTDGMESNEYRTSEDQKDYSGLLTDGQTVKGVSLTVTAWEIDGTVTVYYAVIQEDPNKLFEKGDTISFIKNSAVVNDISVGEYYQVTLRYSEEASYFEADVVKHYKP